MRAEGRILALAVLLSSVGADAGEAPPPSYDEAVAEAERLAGQERFSAAAARLAPVLRHYPEDYALHLAHAYYLLRAGEYAAAARAYGAVRGISDTYDARLGLADALVGEKRWSEGAAVLSALAGERPEEAALRARLAWALYRAGEHERAMAEYRAWSRLAPGSAEAEAGLGWTALALGDRGTARRHFQAALRLDRDSASAKEGLATVGSALRVAPAAYVSVMTYDNNPTKVTHGGVGVALDGAYADRVGVAARYRHTGPLSSGTTTTYGRRRMYQSSAPDFAQDEGFLSLAYFTPRWGVSLLGGGVSYRDSTSGAEAAAFDATVVGATARVTFGVDVLASAARSFYPDIDVTQLGLAARIHLARSLALTLGGESQLGGGERLLGGVADLELRGEHAAIGVSAQLGEALRPVDVATLAVFNIPDRVLYRIGGRGSLRLGRRAIGFAAIELHRYTTALTAAEVESDSQLLTLGLRLDL